MWKAGKDVSDREAGCGWRGEGRRIMRSGVRRMAGKRTKGKINDREKCCVESGMSKDEETGRKMPQYKMQSREETKE